MKFKEKVLSSIRTEKDDEEDFELKDANEESEEDLPAHNSLLESVAKLNKRSKKKLRTEASASISEHNLTSVREKEGKLKIHELLKSVKDASIRKEFKKVEKKKLLKVPSTKPIVERLARQTNYEESKKAVSKWSSIVESNRNAEQLVFPLNEPSSLRMDSSHEFVKRFKPATDLEKEVHSLLNSSQHNLTSDRVLTEAEEKYLKAMSLEEAKARHKELQRMRALMSYQEATMKRQKRIKSKSYHRLLKKDKLKKEMKKFEELKLTAPEMAAKQLQELDKLRALERASLRHKNTGKWAKHHLLRSKHDKDARDALSEQAEVAKQLTRKHETLDNSEDEKFEDESMNEVPTISKTLIEVVNESDEKPEKSSTLNPWLRSAKRAVDSNNENEIKKTESEDVSLDPNKFLTVNTTNLQSLLPDFDENGINTSELLQDDDDEQRKLVQEAFAEDDVINEFKEEKKDAMEKERAKDVNLYLPGWGSWGGAGISTNLKKKERFTRKAAKSKRKDSNLGNVIISEKKDDIISKYMIKDLPFPFTNVSEFENSIRHPIGHNWNPETAFRKMIEPKVVTKMGKVIEPMNEDTLIKYKQDKEPVEKNEINLDDILTLS